MNFVRRQYFRRFLQPISRLRLGPDVVGNTMLVGLAFGLSGPPGIQLVGVLLVWWIGRRAGFIINMPIACLLTGVTNPLTIAPLYTMYFVVGCGAVGCHLGEFRFDAFLQSVETSSFWDTVQDSWRIAGIIFLGSLPFSVSASGAGYYFGRNVGHRLAQRWRQRRARRAAARKLSRST